MVNKIGGFSDIQEVGIFNDTLGQGMGNGVNNNQIPGINAPKSPLSSIPQNINQTNIVGWVNSLAFSSSTYNSISWTSGTITFANGFVYSISSGSFSPLTAITYIYIDNSVSSTVLQTTIIPQNSVGPTKLLVCVAKATVSGKPAEWQVFGTNNQSVFITADNIAANTITGNEIIGNTLSAITADLGSISAGQIVVGSTNQLWLNESSDGSLAIGGNIKANAPFRVSATGTLTATGAIIDGQVVVGTTNKIWLNESSDGVLAVGGSVKANAPFRVEANGDVRGNIFTNKSIFYETVSAPTTNDGQMFCNTNGGSGKVLWGYFGGDTTKQQISMSRMQTSGSFDYTSNTSFNISTWFQPRLLTFNGFFENVSSEIYGTTNGQAGSVSSTSGFSNCFQLDIGTTANVVSGLSIGTTANVVSGLSFTGSPFTSASWTNNTVLSSYSFNNNNLATIQAINVAQNTDSFGANKYPSPDVRAYVTSWSDTGLSIQVNVTSGWRISGNWTVTG